MFPALALVLLAGCAGSPRSGTPDPVTRTDNARVGDYDAATNAGCLGCGMQTLKVVVLDPVAVGASQDSVFALLRTIYQKLGVEVKAVNPQTGEIGNRQFNKTARLGGVFLHEYVNCGKQSRGPQRTLTEFSFR
jgi:hypothetical protein